MKTAISKVLAACIGVAALFMVNVTKAQEHKVYNKVDQTAQFPGGLSGLGHYLGKNLKYPAEARKKHIEGSVFVSFIVEEDGSLSNLKVLRTPDPMLGGEALRVMAASPKWKPGREKGQAVRELYTIPIRFKLG